MRIFSFNLFKWFNKIWVFIFVLALSALMTVQFLLTTPEAREALTPISDFEGATGQVDGNLELGELTLSLQGIEPSANIKILQNGVPIAFFTHDVMMITVKNNSLIEIDGTGVKGKFVVNIEENSSNITFADGKMSVECNGDIAVLARIFVKKG